MVLDTAATESAPTVSPDGRWLAYDSNETGTPLIYVKPFPNIDDDPRRVSPEIGVRPAWSPDGRELFYRRGADLMVAQVETEPTFSSRTPEPLFRLTDYGLIGGVDGGSTSPPTGTASSCRHLCRRAATSPSTA